MIEKRLVSLVCIINEGKKYSDVDVIMITISKPEIFFLPCLHPEWSRIVLPFFQERSWVVESFLIYTSFTFRTPRSLKSEKWVTSWPMKYFCKYVEHVSKLQFTFLFININ